MPIVDDERGTRLKEETSSCFSDEVVEAQDPRHGQDRRARNVAKTDREHLLFSTSKR